MSLSSICQHVSYFTDFINYFLQFIQLCTYVLTISSYKLYTYIVNDYFVFFILYLVSLLFLVPCPEIFKPPINNSVLFGQTANYYCLALSFGLLTYEWKKFDGKNLLPTTITRYTNKNILSGSTIVSNLKIPNVKPSDEGEYCCVAINECGNVTKCAWLDVISKF